MAITHKLSLDGVSPGAFTTSTAGTGDTSASAITPSTNSGWSVVSGGLRGPRLQLDKPAGQASYWEWQFAARTRGQVRFYWYPPTIAPTNAFSFLRIKSGPSSAILALNCLQSTGALRFLDAAGAVIPNTSTGAGAMSFDGSAHRVEFEFDMDEIHLAIYSADGTVLRAGADSTALALGTSFDRLQIGMQNASPDIGTMYFDDIALGDSSGSYLGPAVTTTNQPPVANITGPSGPVASSDTVVVNLDYSDPDGTVSNVEFAQVSGTAAVISGDGQTRSIRMPYVTSPAGEDLTFRLTVTDNNGATTTDDYSVHINRHLSFRKVGGVWRPIISRNPNNTLIPVTIDLRIVSIEATKVTIGWTFFPGSHEVAGAYAARDQAGGEANPWESDLRLGLENTQSFGLLQTGVEYTFSVYPIVDGARVTEPFTITATPSIESTGADIAVIGDSLQYRTDVANMASRERATRDVFNLQDYPDEDIFWYAVNGTKSMTTADELGKTVAQNIADAKTALGDVENWVIALGMNDAGLSDTAFTAAVNNVLNSINQTTGKIFWLGVAYYGADSTTAIRLNGLIKAAVQARPNGVYLDWNGYIHDPARGSQSSLWAYPTNSQYMTALGYAVRDQYLAQAVKLGTDPYNPTTQPPPTSNSQVTSIGSATTNLFDPDADDASPTFYTISGLIVSKKNSTDTRRIFWGHNDNGAASAGGGDIVIHAFDDNGATGQRKILASYTLGGTFNGVGGDWEDIAWGPGPETGVQYLYVGNFGGQASNDDNLKFYRVKEPTVTPGQTKVTATIPSAQVETFTFSRPAGTADSEAFIVDPITGDIFYFQKASNSSARPQYMKVYRVPASQLGAGSRTVTLTEVASILGTTSDQTNNGTITAADITEDGSAIFVTTYQGIWAYNRGANQTVTDALKGTPIYKNQSSWGVESMAIDRGTMPTKLFGMSEGTGSTLKSLDVTWSRVTDPTDPTDPTEPGRIDPSLRGLYNGGHSTDDETLAAFGEYEEIGTDYIQYNFAGWNLASLQARLRRGVHCLITWQTKNTQWIADYAGRNGVTAMNAAEALARQYVVDRLRPLSNTTGVPNGAKVWASAIHEHDVYSNPTGQYQYTGLSGDPVVAAEAMNKLLRMMAEEAPNLMRVVWWGGTTRTTHIANFWGRARELNMPVQVAAEDPYVNGTTYESATQNFQPVFDRYKKSGGLYRNDWVALGDGPVAIGEHGISKYRPSTGVVVHSDAVMANYIKSIPAATKSFKMAFVMYFNRDSGPNGHHKVDDGTHPQAVKAMSDYLGRKDEAGIVTPTDPQEPPPPPTTTVPTLANFGAVVNIADPEGGANPGELTENSGLAVSVRNSVAGGTQIFYGHNDQGAQAKIYAFDDSSPHALIATITLSTGSGDQLEDIYCGLGPNNTPCIWVASIGAGGSDTLYRVNEPAISPNQAHAAISSTPLTWNINNPFNDAEGFFIDPISGHMYLFEKITPSTSTRASGTPFTGRVAKYSNVRTLTTGGTTLEPTIIGSVRTHNKSTNQGGVTAATISSDGSYIAWCNYQDVFGVTRQATETVDQVLLRNNGVPPVQAYYASGWGSEAITFNMNSSRIYTVAEGLTSRLKYAPTVKA